MSSLRNAISEIHEMDDRSAGDGWLCRIHPLAKLMVTLCYICAAVSFPKYDAVGLAGLLLYPLILFLLGELPVKRCLRQMWPVLLAVSLVGAANPWIDRAPMGRLGPVVLTGGMLSMLTLFLKGAFAVAAAWLLMASTGMEQICGALRSLRMPRGAVTVLLLIYRYLIVLLKEVERMSQACRLRAPGQKGIRFSAWGSFAGLLLLRSMDRADTVYESMLLRGYDGEFKGLRFSGKKAVSAAYAAVWISAILLLRLIPVYSVVGGLIMRGGKFV